MSTFVFPDTSIEDYCADDGSTLDPSEIHAYLSRVMYGRRSKADPLWNQVVVAGVKEGKTYAFFIRRISIVWSSVWPLGSPH